MAIFKDPFFSYQGVTVPVRSLAFELGAEPQDATESSDNARQMAAGLDTWAIELEANWTAGSTTSVTHLFGTTAGKSGAFIFRPTTASQSASNPQYSGTAIRTNFGTGGSIGDQHIATVSFVAGSDITIAST